MIQQAIESTLTKDEYTHEGSETMRSNLLLHKAFALKSLKATSSTQLGITKHSTETKT